MKKLYLFYLENGWQVESAWLKDDMVENCRKGFENAYGVKVIVKGAFSYPQTY